ncbi:MAG: hypothetical protein AAFZ15_00235 [Bacteroidota bacterium]
MESITVGISRMSFLQNNGTLEIYLPAGAPPESLKVQTIELFDLNCNYL